MIAVFAAFTHGRGLAPGPESVSTPGPGAVADFCIYGPSSKRPSRSQTAVFVEKVEFLQRPRAPSTH
jgi:hypothetical protein